MPNAEEFEAQFHKRLLAGDPIASEELAEHFLPIVARHLRFRAQAHGVVDIDLINEAAIDAVFDHIRHPEKFSAQKSSLRTYLNLAAERDLINAVQKERRRRTREIPSADVELTVLRGNKESEIRQIRRDFDDSLAGRLEEPRPEKVIRTVRPGRDQAFVRMMMEGERSTLAFAKLLNIADLPPEEQRRIVKQHKDRLKLQLKRWGGKQGG